MASSSSSSNNPSTPNINVPIRIEPTDEYKIQEISYDGQEKTIPPLSMSENLSQLIQRINFTQSIDELREELEKKPSKTDGIVDEDSDDSDERARPSTQSAGPIWPFDSMRTKLRTALTEICVLNDVLAIAKEKKYMVFDAVNPNQTDQRPIVAMMAKKRALASAAQVLMDGAQTLRPTGTTSTDMNLNFGESMLSTSTPTQHKTTDTANEPDFYKELKEMRQSWRLKRVGTTILGDLSDFRPVGNQRFLANSKFEVIRTNPATRGPSNQALAVKVPSDLEGEAYIQVSIIENEDISLVDLCSTSNGRSYESEKATTWQKQLENAQNVLFCKELFCHLAKQAVEYQFVIPTTVTGNQIILALFPDIKLYITLVHKTPNTKSSRKPTEGMKKLQRKHKQVFEHSLHRMFRDFHAHYLRKLQGRDVPRESGPCAMDKQTMLKTSSQESSLDRIVQQAQHLIMRHQTIEVIDTFASKTRDPLIISHWFCLNSPTTSIVRVDIVSHNNEILGRSHMLIYVGTRQLRVITRDCKNMVLGYEPDELRHLLVWQSCLHQFIASDKLSKLLGWYTLILDHNVNVTRQDISSTAFSLVICSSNCSYMISMKFGPQYGLSVEVAQFKDTLNASSNGLTAGKGGGVTNSSGGVGGVSASLSSMSGAALDDGFGLDNGINGTILGSLSNNGAHNEKSLSKFQDLVENFREVDWNIMQGKDFLTKLELLMAALTELN